MSLGGASYAAIELPARSVGSRQLQAGAVEASALGFPLGVESATDTHPEQVSYESCGAQLREGKLVVPPCPLPTPLYRVPGPVVPVDFRAAGRLLLSGTIALQDQEAPNSSEQVVVGLTLDRQTVVSEVTVTIAGGQRLQVPIQALIDVKRGRHSAGLAAKTSIAGVIASSSSLIATALPARAP